MLSVRLWWHPYWKNAPSLPTARSEMRQLVRAPRSGPGRVTRCLGRPEACGCDRGCACLLRGPADRLRVCIGHHAISSWSDGGDGRGGRGQGPSRLSRLRVGWGRRASPTSARRRSRDGSCRRPGAVLPVLSLTKRGGGKVPPDGGTAVIVRLLGGLFAGIEMETIDAPVGRRLLTVGDTDWSLYIPVHRDPVTGIVLAE